MIMICRVCTDVYSVNANLPVGSQWGRKLKESM